MSSSNGIRLSMLVPSIEERRGNFLKRILGELDGQIAPYREEVEVLTIIDNREASIGSKRNQLLKMASGEFLVFIDDDDRIAPEYLDEIMAVIRSSDKLDCIVYDCICEITGWAGEVTNTLYCKYGIEYEYTNDGAGNWRGKPAHTMVWRSSIAKRHAYKHVSAGEDVDWVKRACVEIQDQHRIDKVLYYYDNDVRLSTSKRGTKWRLDHPEEAQALFDRIGQ